MSVVAKLNYLRISPRKVRLVADLIRQKRVERAERILNFTVKEAALPLAKLLKSAMADARNNFHLNTDNLYISKIMVNEGPKYKRWRPRSRGMANQIKKRTSGVILVLDEIESGQTADIKVKRREMKASSSVAQTKEKNTDKGSKELGKGKTEKGLKKFGPKGLSKTWKPKVAAGKKKIFRRKAF